MVLFSLPAFRSILGLLLGVGLFSSQLCAAVKELSLDEAIQMAIIASEDIQKKSHEAEQRQLQYDEVIASLYPQLNGQLKWSHYPVVPERKMEFPALAPGMAPISIATPIKKDYELQASMTVAQIIWAFGKISGALELAEKALNMSQTEKEIIKNEISYGTKMAYFAVLMADETLKIRKRSYEDTLSNKRYLEKRFSNGRSPKGDVIKMEADLSVRKGSLKEAQLNRDLACKRVKVVT